MDSIVSLDKCFWIVKNPKLLRLWTLRTLFWLLKSGQSPHRQRASSRHPALSSSLPMSLSPVLSEVPQMALRLVSPYFLLKKHICHRIPLQTS